MWALNNSGATMSAWSYEIGFVLMQDVMVNDVVQVVLVHVIAIEALRPQLKRIYAVLNQILKDKISTLPTTAATAGIDKTRAKAKTAAEKKDEQDLSEGWEFCVAQHLSAACRAARRPELHYLPFSQLLMRITDHDVSLCRDEMGIKLGGFMVALLAVPTVLALSHETVQDMFLDVILPTAWSCFCIANAYALLLGPWALIVPYTMLILAALYRQWVVVPRIRKRNMERAANGTGYQYTKDELAWQNMNRQMELVHMNTLNVADVNPLGVQHTKAAATKRKKRGSASGDSVMSDLTFQEGGDKQQQAREEESVDGDDMGADLQVPAEIRQMYNPKAREKFIAHKHTRDASLLGMAAVSKWMGLARNEGGEHKVAARGPAEAQNAYDEHSVSSDEKFGDVAAEKPLRGCRAGKMSARYSDVYEDDEKSEESYVEGFIEIPSFRSKSTSDNYMEVDMEAD